MTRKYTITVERRDTVLYGGIKFRAACRIDGRSPEHFSMGRTPSDAIIRLGLYLKQFDPLWEETQ